MPRCNNCQRDPERENNCCWVCYPTEEQLVLLEEKRGDLVKFEDKQNNQPVLNLKIEDLELEDYPNYYGNDFSSSLNQTISNEANEYQQSLQEEIEVYKHEKNARSKLPSEEEKLWMLEEKLESLENDLQRDKSECLFLDWRSRNKKAGEITDEFRKEIIEKKLQRQQHISRAQIQLEGRKWRMAQLLGNKERKVERMQDKNIIKNILLIGRTGSGKSALGNVLVNQDNNFAEVFKESADSVSATKNIQVQRFTVDNTADNSDKIHYLVIDTAGFGDTQLTNKEVLQLFKELVPIIKENGINQIFLVSNGRFTKEEIDIYQLLENVLFDQGVAKYTTIVRTKFPEFTNEGKCEEDRQKFRRENLDLINMSSQIKIIYVDNLSLIGLPLTIKAARESRELSRQRLLLHLGICQEIYNPDNLFSLQQRVNGYQTKTEKLEKELANKERERQQREAQLQQQISYQQFQQQEELNRVKQNFDNQLNVAYAEQQRQIKEANERHQSELAQLRDSQAVHAFQGYMCPQQHVMTFVLEDAYGEEFVVCSMCQRAYNASECSALVRRYLLEEWSKISGDIHNERMRRLRQQIQEQELHNQEIISGLSQQINQRQQSINRQKLAEESKISRQYQQKEDDLRSEITRQTQQRVNERKRIQQEINRLQNEFNQYIEQRMPSNYHS